MVDGSRMGDIACVDKMCHRVATLVPLGAFENCTEKWTLGKGVKDVIIVSRRRHFITINVSVLRLTAMGLQPHPVKISALAIYLLFVR